MYGKIKKNRIIFTLSLICVGLLILVAILINIYKSPYSPIKHTFDRDTGVVTFNLDPIYSLDNVMLHEGYYPQPIFDSETIEVSFCAFDLPFGKHEFVYFVFHKKDGKAGLTGIQFEILHQSDRKILIQMFHNGIQFPGYRKSYTYSY